MKLMLEIEWEDGGDDEQEITKVTANGVVVESVLEDMDTTHRQWNVFHDEAMMHLITVEDWWF